MWLVCFSVGIQVKSSVKRLPCIAMKTSFWVRIYDNPVFSFLILCAILSVSCCFFFRKTKVLFIEILFLSSSSQIYKSMSRTCSHIRICKYVLLFVALVFRKKYLHFQSIVFNSNILHIICYEERVFVPYASRYIYVSMYNALLSSTSKSYIQYFVSIYKEKKFLISTT